MALVRSLPLSLRVALGTLFLAVGMYCLQGEAPFSPGPLHSSPRGAPLGGARAHSELRCAACHPAIGSSQPMNALCLDCHTEVRGEIQQQASLHGRLPRVERCQTCHTEHQGPQATLTDWRQFDHSLTDFPLTGVHRSTSCADCHPNHQYRGTPTSCSACHAEPAVHLGRFGTDCARCHSTSTWRTTALANFNHDLTSFKLTGKHRTIACTACHQNNVFHGTPTSCVACHAEPQVHVGRFGTDCSKCHSTATWKDTRLEEFDHDLAGFKLTGKHRTTACTACHQNNVYRGTPQTCVACHAEPVVHSGKFGTACAACHSTLTWKNATITQAFHKFPLRHGGGKNRGQCVNCHQVSGDYSRYTCYGCHRHDPDKTREKHRRWNIVNLDDCAKCHPTGRKRPGEPAKERALGLSLLEVPASPSCSRSTFDPDVSPVRIGLHETLTPEEMLELVAYIQAVGDPSARPSKGSQAALRE